MTLGSSGGLVEADRQETECSVCGKRFRPRFSYQLQKRGDRLVPYCSARCQIKAMASGAEVACSGCGREFVPEYAYQSEVIDGKRMHFCSMDCRGAAAGGQEPIRRLAVYNLKGGTGKTTTAVSLAAALAELGLRVLLIDADPQGSISVSLGVKNRRGLYQVLVLGIAPEKCAVRARDNLDVILSDRSLAGAEVYLAGRPERHRVMHDRFAAVTGYDLMIIDCSPSVGLLSQNALRCADSLIVPTSCDYLGVVGLQQALQINRELEGLTGHKVELVGVLPTFHDGRLRVCRDAMETLNKYWSGSVLPPIRINAKLREAPANKASIFEHSPRSTGAADYTDLAERVARKHMNRDIATRPKVEVEEEEDESGE